MPGGLAHALILHGDVLQPVVVRVVAAHRQGQHALRRGVHHGVVDTQGHVGACRHKLCRDIDGVADDLPCAGRVALALRCQHDGDVFVEQVTRVVLFQFQVHAHGAACGDEHSAATAQLIAVDVNAGTEGVGLVDDEEDKVAVLVRLALVGQQQREVGHLAGGHAHQAVGAILHHNPRLLNLLRGGGQDVFARLEVLGALLALIRTGGLSATGYEDGAHAVRGTIDVHAQGIIVTYLRE